MDFNTHTIQDCFKKLEELKHLKGSSFCIKEHEATEGRYALFEMEEYSQYSAHNYQLSDYVDSSTLWQVINSHCYAVYNVRNRLREADEMKELGY